MAVVSLMGIIVALIPIIFLCFVVYFVFKSIKGYEKRANEKLILERENTITLQKRVDDLNERVVTIEKLLKEVE